MKINTDLNIGDTVAIPEINISGKVMSIWITEQGVQYQVRYFDNCECRIVYFFPDELIAAKKVEK